MRTIDKRIAIMDAAMSEFAEKGFDQASTNAISKRAGVSKGLIFHYFGNKEALFQYLIDHVMEQFGERHMSQLEFHSDDFIERLYEAYKFKLSVLVNEGPITMFTREFLFESKYRDEVLFKQQEILMDIWKRLFDDVDISNFKTGLELTDIYTLSTFVFKGIGDALIEQKGYTMEDFVNGCMDDEVDKWLQILKICIYK